MQQFTERYAEKIRGVLSCLDRIVITGTIPRICFAEGMTGYLYEQGIRIFDYPQLADGLREEIRANAEKIASKNGLEIEFIRKNTFRKEDGYKEDPGETRRCPGLVDIFSAMEPCASYKPWHDKKTHKTFLKPDSGKRLHYYFYFIVADLYFLLLTGTYLGTLSTAILLQWAQRAGFSVMTSAWHLLHPTG